MARNDSMEHVIDVYGRKYLIRGSVTYINGKIVMSSGSSSDGNFKLMDTVRLTSTHLPSISDGELYEEQGSQTQPGLLWYNFDGYGLLKFKGVSGKLRSMRGWMIATLKDSKTPSSENTEYKCYDGQGVFILDIGIDNNKMFYGELNKDDFLELKYNIYDGHLFHGEFQSAFKMLAGRKAHTGYRDYNNEIVLFEYEGFFDKTLTGTARVIGMGKVYDGEISRGKPEGLGHAAFTCRTDGTKDGQFIMHEKGMFRQGHLHGYGRTEFNNGDFYDGEYRDGDFHGEGKMVRSGFAYKGQFEQGLAHGKGHAVGWGIVYKGMFNKGVPLFGENCCFKIDSAKFDYNTTLPILGSVFKDRPTRFNTDVRPTAKRPKSSMCSSHDIVSPTIRCAPKRTMEVRKLRLHRPKDNANVCNNVRFTKVTDVIDVSDVPRPSKRVDEQTIAARLKRRQKYDISEERDTPSILSTTPSGGCASHTEVDPITYTTYKDQSLKEIEKERQQNSKQCPFCGQRMMRHNENNHIKCTCGQEFCFLCQCPLRGHKEARSGYNHFQYTACIQHGDVYIPPTPIALNKLGFAIKKTTSECAFSVDTQDAIIPPLTNHASSRCNERVLDERILKRTYLHGSEHVTYDKQGNQSICWKHEGHKIWTDPSCVMTKSAA
tara:strand:+ start:1730 stop:3703 length:1974 start_codon:yes stop_codon:yes gene_type:complete